MGKTAARPSSMMATAWTCEREKDYLAALYPQGPPAPLRIIPLSRGDELEDLSEERKKGTCFHVVLEPGKGIMRAWHLMRLSRRFSRHRFSCRLIGLEGMVDQPRIVVPLNSTILHYIHSIAFRGTDSAARVLLKRLVGLLPKGLTWKGPLVLIGSPVPETFDRFVLLTGDRKIVFLFRNNEKVPWAVRKSGAREELLAEHSKHRRAIVALGRRVPGILEMTEDGATAAMTLEYIRERFLGNVVAAAFRRKKEVFIREALGHLDFCLEVYRLMAGRGEMVDLAVEGENVSVLLDALDTFHKNTEDASLLRQALTDTLGMTLPHVMQHGDFCVRNILLADGERGRVLIDWEDMQERRWSLVDFVLLRLSLNESYAALFPDDSGDMDRLPAMVDGLAAAEAELMGILNMDHEAFMATQVLSLACLCRQNLNKGRVETATAIYRELVALARANMEPSGARILL